MTKSRRDRGPHVKAGRMLVVMLVGNRLSEQFSRRVMGGVTAQPILDAKLFERVGKNFFVGQALDLPRGEGMVTDDGRSLAQYDTHISRRECTTIKITEIAELTRFSSPLHPMTEVVFTSGVELHIRRQRAAVLVQKSDQSAVMVEMAMAHDQRVDFLRIDADDIEIVEQCLRRVAVIEHECAILTGLLRLKKQG